MSDTTIEIDFEVYKLIEAERKGFDEPRIAALRRLLRLEDRPTNDAIAPPPGRSWYGSGVTLPHGTLLKMYYSKRKHEGLISNGAWLIEGKAYDTPSGAAVSVARTKYGAATQLNGWNYWQAKVPGSDTWTLIRHLRKRSDDERKRQMGQLRQGAKDELQPI